MAKRLSGLRNLRIPALVIGLLLIPFAMYEMYYVEGRETYLKSRSFRVLSAIGMQLDHLVNVEADKLRAAGSPFDRQKEADDRLRREWIQENFSETTFEGSWKADTQDVPAQYGRGGSFALNLLSDQAFLAADLSYSTDGPAPKVREIRNLDSALRTRIAKVAPDFFDDVLICDEQGNVVFEWKDFGLHVRRIDDILALANASTATAQSSASPSTKQEAAQRFALLSQASTLTDILLAGSTYKLFLQPVAVTIHRQPEPKQPLKKVVICGLWKSRRWRSETFALPYEAVSWGAFVLIAAFCLSWPFVKVTFMSPKQRFRVRDGWNIVLTITGAAVALTVLMANLYYWAWESDLTEKNLKQLAKQIQLRSNAELSYYLGAFDHVLGEPPMAARLANAQDWQFSKLSPLCTRSKTTYHHFDQIFVANEKGDQMIKLLVKGAVTPRTNVADLPFFSAIHQGPLIRESDGKRQYAVQMLHSPNTGEFQMLIVRSYSNPLQHPIQESDGPDANAWAVAIVARPTSLVNAVLPPGYGFAVIGPDGMVEFHSDSARNLEENFIEECNRDPYLLASMAERKEEVLPIEYMGESETAYVTSLRGLAVEPLPLIVFRLAARDEMVHLGVVLYCAVLLALPVAVLVSVAFFDTLRGRRRPPKIIWPKKENANGYAYLTLANLVCTGVFVEFALRSPAGGPGGIIVEAAMLIVVTLSITFLSFPLESLATEVQQRWLRRIGITRFDVRVILVLVAGFLVIAVDMLMKSKAHVNLPWWESAGPVLLSLTAAGASFYVPRIPARYFQWTYAVAAVSVLLGVMVVPTTALFRASWDTVDLLATRHAELTTAREVSERNKELHGEYQFADINGKLNGFLKDTLNSGWYQKGWFELSRSTNTSLSKSYTKALTGGENVSSRLEHLLIDVARLCLPANTLGAELVESDIGRMRSSEWVYNDSGEPGLLTEARVLTAVPEASRKAPLWMPLLVMVVLVMFTYWLKRLVQNVFLTDSYPTPPLDEVHWRDASDITSCHLVMGHPRSRKSTKLRCIADMPKIDLRTSLNAELRFEPYRPPARVIAMDHFEFNINDSDFNYRRLELLEELLYKHKYILVIISTLDPLYYLQEGGASILSKSTDPASAATEASKLLDRWSRVLSKFSKVQLADDSGPEFSLINDAVMGADPLPKLSSRDSQADSSQGHKVFQVASTNPSLQNHLPAGAKSFAAEMGRGATASPAAEQKKFAKLICDECHATAYLRRKGVEIFQKWILLNDKPLDRPGYPDSEYLVELLLDQLDSYYRVLWSSFTEKERLVLYQLSSDGWANPLNRTSIQQLQRKELVSPSVPYAIMNESFRRFTLAVTNKSEVEMWQQEQEESPWHSYRIGLVTLFIVLGAWLLYAQKELFQLSISFMVALGGAITAVVNIFSSMKSKSADGKKT